MVKISILMPIYNGIEFIGESVGSVLSQTWTDWKLIVGVNGHPEGSIVYQKANEWASDKIRVVDFGLQLPRGKAAAMNALLAMARGSYVAVMDVDDIWMPEKLALQAPWLDKYDVIGTQCVYFGDANLEGKMPALPMGDITRFPFLQVNPIINSSALIRRDCLNKEKEAWTDRWFGLDDYELWLRLWTEGKTFYNCRDVAVKHRIHRTSAFNAQGNHRSVADLVRHYKK
jgi:glycosyltransferase involved in cell wall biosynthesis